MNTLRPLSDSPFFNGSEIVVTGRYGASMSVSTTIDYKTGTEVYSNNAGSTTSENSHIERIWAQHRISYLLKCVQLYGENETLKNEIVQLGMHYGIIVGEYTALILTAYDVDIEYSDLYRGIGTYTTATWTTGTGNTGGLIPGIDLLMIDFLPVLTAGAIIVVGIIIFWKRRH